MPLGPGKFDHYCTLVRRETGADAVFVIVVGGHQGGGFACQADAITAAKLPDFLENIAAEIRADLPGLNRPSH